MSYSAVAEMEEVVVCKEMWVQQELKVRKALLMDFKEQLALKD